MVYFSSSLVTSLWNVSGKFILKSLIFALFFAMVKAKERSPSCCQVLSLCRHVLTWCGCAAIWPTLPPIQLPKALHALHCTSFLSLKGDCPSWFYFLFPFWLLLLLLFLKFLLPLPKWWMAGGCGIIGMSWPLFVANILTRLFIPNSAGRLSGAVM